MIEEIKNITNCFFCGKELMVERLSNIQVAGIALSCNCSYKLKFNAGNFNYNNFIFSYEENVWFEYNKKFVSICNGNYKFHNGLYVNIFNIDDTDFYRKSFAYILTQQELIYYINKATKIIDIEFLS